MLWEAAMPATRPLRRRTGYSSTEVKRSAASDEGEE